MNITFSFTTRLTIIALLSFLIFLCYFIVVYELGKEHAIRSLRKKIEEYLWMRKIYSLISQLRVKMITLKKVFQNLSFLFLVTFLTSCGVLDAQ